MTGGSRPLSGNRLGGGVRRRRRRGGRAGAAQRNGPTRGKGRRCGWNPSQRASSGSAESNENDSQWLAGQGRCQATGLVVVFGGAAGGAGGRPRRVSYHRLM